MSGKTSHPYKPISYNKYGGTMMQPENTASSQNTSEKYSNKRLEETQRQVQDVVGIMRNNVEKIVDREDKLNELDQRATYLSSSASEFQTTSRRLKKKYWWKNLKMMLILGAVVVTIIAIILIIIFAGNGGDGGSGGDVTPTVKSQN